MVRKKNAPNTSYKSNRSSRQGDSPTPGPSRSDASPNTTSMQKKKRRNVEVTLNSKTYMVSRAVLKEIRRMQMSTNLLIPKASFSRVVREIVAGVTGMHDSFRFQGLAMMALQEAAEAYLTQFLEDSSMCSMHAKRVTLLPRDMHLVLQLRTNFDAVQQL